MGYQLSVSNPPLRAAALLICSKDLVFAIRFKNTSSTNFTSGKDCLATSIGICILSPK